MYATNVDELLFAKVSCRHQFSPFSYFRR